MTIRIHPELGEERLCVTCKEWWPTDREFWKLDANGRILFRSCRSCRWEKERGRAIPIRPTTHRRSGIDVEAKRARDRQRKRDVRRDPVLGDKLRARQVMAQRRYYERNRAAVLAAHRERYAQSLDRPVRSGFGRPRMEDAA